MKGVKNASENHTRPLFTAREIDRALGLRAVTIGLSRLGTLDGGRRVVKGRTRYTPQAVAVVAMFQELVEHRRGGVFTGDEVANVAAQILDVMESGDFFSDGFVLDRSDVVRVERAGREPVVLAFTQRAADVVARTRTAATK
jgi:hypothetical protein